MMNRRALIGTLLALPVGLVSRGALAGGASSERIAQLQANWTALLPAGFEPVDPAQKVTLSAQQWRVRLQPMQFEVLRKEGTERPFSSALNDEKRPGVFLCAGCELPLFSSAMKYDSGTGWPSFFTAIPGALQTKRDFKLVWPRTEYHCARCGGHQGHVFDDGPAPTGQRWCNNGVALRFVAAEG